MKCKLVSAGIQVKLATEDDCRKLYQVLVAAEMKFFTCGLIIKVELLRTWQGILQCHKCQGFSNGQNNCHIEYRCLKCGEKYFTHACEKPRTTPSKCANCEGKHLSSHIKRPKNPYGARLIKYVEAEHQL